MVKRIAIFGAESTGKSTLAAKLGAHFGAPVVPEFVRGFWDAHDGVIVAGDLEVIAKGQMESEDEAALVRPSRQAQDLARQGDRELLICDTELLTNVLWADLLFPGHCPAWVRAEAEARCRRYALYLLCDTDMAFAPDPQRCFPDEAGRKMCRQLWRDTLVSRNLPFVDIRGEPAEREKTAIAAVAALG